MGWSETVVKLKVLMLKVGIENLVVRIEKLEPRK